MNTINIKEWLLIAALFAIATSIIIGTFAICGTIEQVDVHEEYLAIPDAVFEYIDLQLPDGSDEAAYVDYWYKHRSICDSIIIANID